MPLAFFCKRHGRISPPPRHFDRAFGVFLQKARSVAPSAPPFRPCLWRFFEKGTVGRDPSYAISTVPLTIFCERHGRSHPLLRSFDRAFGAFLKKARSAATPPTRFRPCLWRFFAKGTVAQPLRTTPPLAHSVIAIIKGEGVAISRVALPRRLLGAEGAGERRAESEGR